MLSSTNRLLKTVYNLYCNLLSMEKRPSQKDPNQETEG